MSITAPALVKDSLLNSYGIFLFTTFVFILHKRLSILAAKVTICMSKFIWRMTFLIFDRP